MKEKNMKGLKGALVQVEFWDHSFGGESDGHDLMKFKIWGTIQNFNKRVLVVRQWELQNGSSEDKKANNEVAKILVPSIIDIKFLQIIPDIKGDQ